MSTISKRKNERGQMRREDYEAQEENEEEESGAGGQFKVASKETMAKRRIIRRSTGGAAGIGKVSAGGEAFSSSNNNSASSSIQPTTATMSTPSSSFAPPSSAGGGLFGGVSLVSSASKSLTATSTGVSGGGGLFGGVNLVPSKSSTTSAPSLFFKTASSKPTTKSSSSLSEAEKVKKEIDSRQELMLYASIRYPYSGKALKAVLEKFPKGKGYDAEKGAAIAAAAERKAAEATPSSTKTSSAETSTASSAPAPSSLPAGPVGAAAASTSSPSKTPSLFSFKPPSGTKTEAGSSAGENNNKPTTPFKGFTFGGEGSLFSTKSSNPSQIKSSAFSFTATAATSQAPPASTASSNKDDDDADGFPKEETEKILKAENKDETMLLEMRAKLYEKQADKWKSYAVGVVQLMQHKTDKKQHRIICRDQIGKIYLNTKVVKNMEFRKSMEKTKKGLVQGTVTFKGLAAESEDGQPGIYILKTQGNQIDELHRQLESMASNS